MTGKTGGNQTRMGTWAWYSVYGDLDPRRELELVQHFPGTAQGYLHPWSAMVPLFPSLPCNLACTLRSTSKFPSCLGPPRPRFPSHGTRGLSGVVSAMGFAHLTSPHIITLPSSPGSKDQAARQPGLAGSPHLSNASPVTEEASYMYIQYVPRKYEVSTEGNPGFSPLTRIGATWSSRLSSR